MGISGSGNVLLRELEIGVETKTLEIVEIDKSWFGYL